jgi:hypothetical protein
MLYVIAFILCLICGRRYYLFYWTTVPCEFPDRNFERKKTDAFRTQIRRTAAELTDSVHYKRFYVLAVQIKALHTQTVEPPQEFCSLGLSWCMVVRPWLSILPREGRKVNREKLQPHFNTGLSHKMLFQLTSTTSAMNLGLLSHILSKKR